jgi:succinyl-diaminopimelate desuccinylase
VLELTRDLVARASVTPDDGGCQPLIAERLAAMGFEVEPMPFGEVANLWARRGSDNPLLCLAGHTDVVPTGPESDWLSPPFLPTIDGGQLRGRGTADMKAALAAFVVACEDFLGSHPDHAGSLAFLITSDEEGIALDGTRRVIDALSERGERIDYCLIGEPSSGHRLGDTARVGRRGSLSAELSVKGIQGHVAYADKARNPLHDLAPALAELCAIEWDAGNAHFPPTSFQATNISAGTGVMNVIPGRLELRFNLRYCTEQTMDGLMARVGDVLDRHGLDYEIVWRDVGRPFMTAGERFSKAIIDAVREITGLEPELSTGGGTSDGRFIAPAGAQVIELGHINASIHQVNESVPVADLEPLKMIYQRILELMLLPATGQQPVAE